MRRRRTVSKACVLAALSADEPAEHYGFEIARTSGVALGTVYPILAGFESDGWVTSWWEDVDPTVAGRPRRRLYQLTLAGREMAIAEVVASESSRPDASVLSGLQTSR